MAKKQSSSNSFYCKNRLGAHSRVGETVGTEQDIDVAEIITHEKYHSPLRYSHDIALLRQVRQRSRSCLLARSQSTSSIRRPQQEKEVLDHRVGKTILWWCCPFSSTAD